MIHVFIADLHLSADDPRLVRGFLSLLQQYQPLPQVHLYILGDWFNAWLGDDDIHDAWIIPIIQALKQFTSCGHRLYFLVGNRDFALGQTFLDLVHGTLLPERTTLNIGHYRILIEHGDLLCTDDVAYQRFRRWIRHPYLLACMQKLPLSWRKGIAHYFRKKSRQANQQKAMTIMDVNEQAVLEVMQSVDILIHGHTHKPHIHKFANGKQRIVLGDWRINHHQGQAMILEFIDQQPHFKSWTW